jgi:hypothetical protein
MDVAAIVDGWARVRERLRHEGDAWVVLLDAAAAAAVSWGVAPGAAAEGADGGGLAALLAGVPVATVALLEPDADVAVYAAPG